VATNLRHSEWLEYVRLHVRANFETGLLYWKHPLKGRNLYKPLGCKDSNGYIKTSVAGRACYAHQIIFFLFYGRWVKLIDHDNRIRDDNRPNNLLESNHSANGMNSKIWKTNTTGVKGVSFSKQSGYKVTIQGKFLGYFVTAAKAKEVADAYYKHLRDAA
jgi:hypothetical protein